MNYDPVTFEPLDPEPHERTDPEPRDNGSAPSVSWPVLDEAAYCGLPGLVLQVVAPETEADPAGLLTSFLTGAGNLIGPKPFMRQAAVHRPILFPLIIGETAKSRKGTSWSTLTPIWRRVDKTWLLDRAAGGLSSGEGLIAAVSDETDEDDPRPKDRRLLAVEPEFASVLRRAGRQGSTLSQVLRQSWDGDVLTVRTRANPLQAQGAHISVLGHITVPELRRELLEVEQANGFANRFLYVCVRRQKLLPRGGNLTSRDYDELGELVKGAVARARRIGEMRWSQDGGELWDELYVEMAEDDPGGLLGAITARPEPQTLRLAMVYALLDGQADIGRHHLEAAWAVWRYCRDSAAYIFGDSLGDPVADDLLEALRAAGDQGLTGTEQRDLFSRHESGARIELARELLESRGLAFTEQVPTGGRPRTVTYAIRTRDQSDLGDERSAA